MNEDLNIQKERFRSTYQRMVEVSEETADMIIADMKGMTVETLSSSVNLVNILAYAGLLPKSGHMPLASNDETRILSALNDKLASIFSHYEKRPMVWLDRVPPHNPSLAYMVTNVDFGDSGDESKANVSQECLDFVNKVMKIYFNIVGSSTTHLYLRMNFKSVSYNYTSGVTDLSDAKRFLNKIVSQY